MACDAAKTNMGFDAPNPFAVDPLPAACGYLDDPERLATLTELAAHPRGCNHTNFEDLAKGALGAVSDKVDEFYGRPVAPCYGVRGFPASGCNGFDIAPALRVDKVEIGGSCSCGASTVWTEVDLCEVVVHSSTGLPPYNHIGGCTLCPSCGTSIARVTAVWGEAWPISYAIKFAVITVATKLFQVSKETARIIQNSEDGSTTYNVPDFSMDELNMLLPQKGRHYYGKAA